MKIEQAKEFYFEHKGDSMSMHRADAEKYNCFVSLDIGDDVLNEWTEKLIGITFDALHSDNGENAWLHTGTLIRLINKSRDADQYCLRLIRETERLSFVPAQQKILIMESLAGRTKRMTDGGIYLICTKSRYSKQLCKILFRFLKYDRNTFVRLCRNEKQRYRRARMNVLRALFRFA